MKWRAIISLIVLQLFFAYQFARGQVWNGDLIFSSQADVDNFATTSYTSVNGNLQITDARDNQHDIRNLAGLAGLTSVSGIVYITNNNVLVNTVYLNLVSIGGANISSNASLTAINGLPLTSVSSGIAIEGNASLSSITAFNSLREITGGLVIQSNPLLTNLGGFSNLSVVRESSLIIGYNNSLANLDAFSSLTQSYGLSIRFNPVLTNINGLTSLAHVGFIDVRNNPLLLNLDGLTNLTSVTNSIDIGNNASLQNVSGISNLNTINLASINIHHNDVLTSINGPASPLRMGALYIEENPALTNISGFSALRTAVGIEISSNRSLMMISGFNLLDTVLGNMRLRENTVLSTISAFSNLSFIRGNFISISNFELASVAPMPRLDSIGGDFNITLDTMLTTLDFISNVRGISRSFRISSCYRLFNITGLSNLRSTGDLNLLYCPQISSITALSGLKSLNGSVVITGLSSLLNVSGLHNIKKVGGDFQLSGNSQLDLNALISLDSVGHSLTIAFNPLVTNLNGLSNVRKAEFVAVQNNSTLANFCGLYGLYAAGGPSGATFIFQNLVNPTPQQIINAGACASVPLPVSLKLINIRCESNKVILNWVTTNEHHNKEFVVERSTNGSAWSAVGLLPALANNEPEHKYIFNDDHPLSNGFYRLAQYDIDGTVHYSKALRSACSIKNDFSIWPNPVTDKVFISMSSANTSVGLIRIFDNNGVLVRSERVGLLAGVNQFELDLSGIAAGIYILEAQLESGAMKQTRLLVKR